MNTYLVGIEAWGDECDAIDAASAEEAAQQYVRNHYCFEDYGSIVTVREAKVTVNRYEVTEPTEALLVKV